MEQMAQVNMGKLLLNCICVVQIPYKHVLSLRVLGAIIYWLFVFVVTIVLLSLLIAQFSVSFEEQKEMAEQDVFISRMKLLQQIHIIFNLWPINKISCCCCPQKIANTSFLKVVKCITSLFECFIG